MQCLPRRAAKVKQSKRVRGLAQVFSFEAISPVILLILLLILPVSSPAQSDPLSPSYRPTIDVNPADYPSNIWITDTLQKVLQDSGAAGTLHWGTFYGTQNEFVDFQVHVQAPTGGIANLTVTSSDFVQSLPASYTISSSSTNIIVYREAYMNVNGQVSGTASTLYGVTGYYPDILIPTVDPYYHQTTNAWPFTVAAGKNQSAWVDVHIPPTALPGYYLGSITVKSGGTTLATMPVILAVWQWPSAGYMPSTSSLQSHTQTGYADMCTQAFGGYSSCGSYPGAGGSPDSGVTLSIIDQAIILLDHRYSSPNPINSYTTDFTGLETYWGPLLNGTAANTQTLLPGAKITSITYPQESYAYAQNWVTEFQKKGWLSTLFDYSCDEPPNGCAWATINTNATSLHATKPPMPALVTTWLANATTNGVLNSIDWMVVPTVYLDPLGGSLLTSTYNTWLAGNCCGAGSSPVRQIWSYQACGSTGTCSNGYPGPSNYTYPNYVIDGKPAATRVMEWLTFFHAQTGELYYYTTNCWSNSCGYPAQTTDPWVSVYAYGNWGDGVLLYPGTTAKIGTTNPIFLPSVRLKHIRDGMQDYEYLYKLSAAGKGSLVMTQINSWITNSYSFDTTGKGLQAARMVIGNALHQLSYPVPLSPPTNLTLSVQ